VPLVPPRGIYGNIAGTFRPAIDVFGVLEGQTTYTRAKYVWVWCGTNEDGAWQVVWGATISPPVAPAVAYEEAGTQVRVTWTLPTPNISNGWRVYRPDGSLAGTAAATATEFVDGSPLPGTGTYSVAGIDATGNESERVPSNSLTISLQPATATAVLSGTTATVSWTTGPDGQPDSWSVWNKTDGVWASTPLAATARSHPVTGLVPGKQYVFSVYPYLSGQAVANQGTPRDTATVSVPAAVPTSVVLAAINPPTAGNASADQIQLSWAAPASGSASGYEVESSTNGTTWTASTDDASPVVFVSSVALYARVRATSPGGVSPWVQAGPVSPHPDEPANVPASVTLVATNPPLSNLRLSWAAPAGAVTGYEVQTSPNNSTWSASSDDTTPSDWATTAAGYMRVRSLSAGGASGWVTKGPVTPVNDVTDPPAATITSWKPESSYGRMVVRGNWANNADVAFGEMWWKVGSGAYTKVWGKSAVTPGAAFARRRGAGRALTFRPTGPTVPAPERPERGAPEAGSSPRPRYASRPSAVGTSRPRR
jgi:Fibronectin type III domain